MRFYTILAGALFCSIVPVLKAAPEPCSAADLTGAYGLLQSGAILSVGPFSSIGVATFDGAGHWTLAETVSVNGDFSPSVGSGDYTVKPDCTGSLMLRTGVSAPVRNMSMILLNYGNEIHTIVTNAGNITTAVLKSIRSRQCSNATLKGDYSYVQKAASPLSNSRAATERSLRTRSPSSSARERIRSMPIVRDLRPPAAGAAIW